jgi:hypothetical protein
VLLDRFKACSADSQGRRDAPATEPKSVCTQHDSGKVVRDVARWNLVSSSWHRALAYPERRRTNPLL